MVRHPQDSSIDVIEPPNRRSVSVDVGPFDDQADLLQFAILLESEPTLGAIDLIDAEPESALFVVRARSAGEVAALLAGLPDYAITATTFGNMVSAKIEPARKAAAILYAAPIHAAPRAAAGAIYVAAAPKRWWRRAALAVVMGTAAAGILLVSLNGVPMFRSTTAPQTRPVLNAVPAVNAPTETPAPVSTARPATSVAAAPVAAPSATAAPAQTPAVPSATATPVPTATATPVPVVSQRYTGSFSAALGSIRALNGCVWETPLSGSISMNLNRAADGSLSGQARMNGTVAYRVTETPSGATCNASSVQIEASGTADAVGGAVSASLSGVRELVVTFNGVLQGDSVVGDMTFQRVLSTASSFGNTSETRIATIAGVTLSRG